MQTEKFIDQVKAAGPSLEKTSHSEHARSATLATIQALGEHLPVEQTRRLASQLPRELAQAAEAGAELNGGRQPETIQLAGFYEKVALKANIPHQDAAGYARATTQTLREAITAGEMSDVAFDLPRDLSGLLSA